MADITTFYDPFTGYIDTEAKKYMCHGKNNIYLLDDEFKQAKESSAWSEVKLSFLYFNMNCEIIEHVGLTQNFCLFY